MKKFLSFLKDGLFLQNPSFVLLLGNCPLLATSTSLTNAIGMGLSAMAVLVCSNVVISLLRKIIPNQVRIAAYIVVIAGFVTAVELLLKAFIPSLYDALGIYIPLIVVNCIILARAEAFASKNGVLDSALDGFCMGLGFTLALALMAFVRELLGSGTLFGLRIFPADYAAVLMVLPVGGFLTLGFLIAVFRRFTARFEKKEGE